MALKKKPLFESDDLTSSNCVIMLMCHHFTKCQMGSEVSSASVLEDKLFSHHAAVEILLHLAESVRRRLSLARDNDADVGDGQGGVRLALGRPPIGDVDALGGIATDVSRAAAGCGLDYVAALLQSLLPLVQHAAGMRQNAAVSQAKAHISL